MIEFEKHVDELFTQYNRLSEHRNKFTITTVSEYRSKKIRITFGATRLQITEANWFTAKRAMLITLEISLNEYNKQFNLSPSFDL